MRDPEGTRRAWCARWETGWEKGSRRWPCPRKATLRAAAKAHTGHRAKRSCSLYQHIHNKERKSGVFSYHTHLRLLVQKLQLCVSSLGDGPAWRRWRHFDPWWNTPVTENNVVSTRPTRVLVSVSHEKACIIWRQGTGQDYTFIRCLPCAPYRVSTSHSVFLSLTKILWGVIIPGLKMRHRDGPSGAKSGSDDKAPFSHHPSLSKTNLGNLSGVSPQLLKSGDEKKKQESKFLKGPQSWTNSSFGKILAAPWGLGHLC